MSNMERNGSNENRGVIVIDLMGEEEIEEPKKSIKKDEKVLIEYDKIKHYVPELITHIVTIIPEKKDKLPIWHEKKHPNKLPNQKKKNTLH
ncbi:MAG: hypothetical protein AABY22_34590 [Nanoarchaeota archaeon]